MTLYNGSGAIASNDNWRDFDGSSVALETRISNRGLAPGDDRESVIVATLTPGAYTVGLTGVGGQTGVGLIEVFEF